MAYLAAYRGTVLTSAVIFSGIVPAVQLQLREYFLDPFKGFRYNLADSSQHMPLSSAHSQALLISAYLSCVWLVRKYFNGFLKDSPSFLKLAVAHNLILALVSLVLLLMLSDQVWPLLRDGGVHFAICDQKSWDIGALQRIYFLNQIVKVWEFGDTFILILRGKPIDFLHIYHHAMTELLTWNQLREASAVAWVPIIANLAVHVLMYLYFAITLLNGRPWWRQLLTTMQISQFLFDIVLCVYASVHVILNGQVLFGSTRMQCHGTMLGAFFGNFVLISYLLLFLRFYRRNYGGAPAAAAISR